MLHEIQGKEAVKYLPILDLTCVKIQDPLLTKLQEQSRGKTGCGNWSECSVQNVYFTNHLYLELNSHMFKTTK